MPGLHKVVVVSDIHYASAAEKERGSTELNIISNPLLRLLIKAYRHYIWRRDPFAHNHLLDRFLDQTGGADFIVANGDYSCDTAFVGVSDQAACASVSECLGKLRNRAGPRFRATVGDHELGKMSLAGGRGGMRLASWHTLQNELGVDPFWSLEFGAYTLIGVTSSLLAYPVYEPETLPGERAEWKRLREQHLDLIRGSFSNLRNDQRAVLFCHDPTALPFLWQDDCIRKRLAQLEFTIIGHLHSDLFVWKSRLLSGMPPITFLGNAVRRMSTALSQGRLWRHFRLRLCPSLAGIELLKDGGYGCLELHPEAKLPARWQTFRIPQSCSRNSSPAREAQGPLE
jgi:hypothetical protein